MRLQITSLLIVASLSFGVQADPMAHAGPSSSGKCLQDQLQELHVHWHALLAEKELAARQRMLDEHRNQLRALSDRRSNLLANQQGNGECADASLAPQHDLDNMLEMHTMMMHMLNHSGN